MSAFIAEEILVFIISHLLPVLKLCINIFPSVLTLMCNFLIRDTNKHMVCLLAVQLCPRGTSVGGKRMPVAKERAHRLQAVELVRSL